MSKHIRDLASLAEVPDAPPEIKGLLIAATIAIKLGQQARLAGRWSEAAEVSLVEHAIFAECVRLHGEAGPFRVNGLLERDDLLYRVGDNAAHPGGTSSASVDRSSDSAKDADKSEGGTVQDMGC